MRNFSTNCKILNLGESELNFKPESIHHRTSEQLAEVLIKLKNQYHTLAKKNHPDKSALSKNSEQKDFNVIKTAYEEAKEFVENLIQQKKHEVQNEKESYFQPQPSSYNASFYFNIYKFLELEIEAFIKYINTCNQNLAQEVNDFHERILTQAYHAYINNQMNKLSQTEYQKYVKNFNHIKNNYENTYIKNYKQAYHHYVNSFALSKVFSTILSPLKPILIAWRGIHLQQNLDKQLADLKQAKPLHFLNWINTVSRQNAVQSPPLSRNEFFANGQQTPEYQSAQQEESNLQRLYIQKLLANQRIADSVKGMNMSPIEAKNLAHFSLFSPPKGENQYPHESYFGSDHMFSDEDDTYEFFVRI